jgi:hypothetical protein
VSARRHRRCSARGRACAGSRTRRACSATALQPPASAGSRRRRGPVAWGRGGQETLGWRRRQHTDAAGGQPAPRKAAGAQVGPTTGQHARKRACRPWAVAWGRSTDAGRLAAAATTQHALNRGPAARPATRPARRPPRPAARPAAGHIRAGLNSSRPSPPAARLAGSAEPRRLGGQPDLGLGRPGGRPDFSDGPAGFGRSAGRIWGVGQPVWGGRPAGFGGSAGRVGRAASRSPLTAQPPLSGHRFLLALLRSIPRAPRSLLYMPLARVSPRESEESNGELRVDPR